MPHVSRPSTAQKPSVIGGDKGIVVKRRYTNKDTHPFDEITWDKREATITNANGEVVFSQKDIEIPSFWSQQATNIVVSKYFAGQIDTPARETSVKQMVTRVAKTMADWGRKDGYFKTEEDAQTFEDELTHILVFQKCAFNSPVWFNVGVHEVPQCSACFIISVQDNMDSILEWIKKEGRIFKGGSGSGVSLSRLRGSKEQLSHGGIASGPVSFMRGADASAGAIKSGGTTRRAAKMVVLDVDHPDIKEFVNCKAEEEKKAWALGEQGYDMSLNGSAWTSIQFQNANNSVRVTDEFMEAVVNDEMWDTKNRMDGNTCESIKAREIMDDIAEAGWICGDPGVQFDTVINKWHTCSETDRIFASNPCSEYMFLDDTACNLASINLMRHIDINGELDIEAFEHTAQIIITAMEITVGNSAYPTEEITKNSHDYRPLGIGYANLGALLMSHGLPYDSDEGRHYAAAITSLLSGTTYAQSSKIAREMGSFAGYKKNETPMLKVLGMHKDASYEISNVGVPADLMEAGQKSWEEATKNAKNYGVRNSQISVLAPTGTIAFLMDCDTTGIEPDIALVKYKWLVGGGMMKIVNKTVPLSLKRLGYSENETEEILAYLDKNDTVEGAPHLKNEHLAVFDCAFAPQNGTRSISHLGHIKMMGAVQPFISGAISKTVNMPKDATPEDIANTYIEAWKLGVKAIAIYRDGSKRTQPLTINQNSEENGGQSEETFATAPEPVRRRLPDERQAVTHKFSISGHEGYITVGLYDDGRPGELFIVMAKEGSVISGLMDSFATSISIGLQYGVPIETLIKKFAHTRFEPSGFTSNPHIRVAKSVVDYIFRWLGLKFLAKEELMSLGVNGYENIDEVQDQRISTKMAAETPIKIEKAAPVKEQESITFTKTEEVITFTSQEDAPPCDTCGSIMVRNAACYKCMNCGSTSGCS